MQFVVHIGATKTGSSLLQEKVFPNVEGLEFLGKENNQQYPRWLIDWIYMDDLAFEASVERIRASIYEVADAEQVNLISAEAFFSGGRFKQSVDRILKILPQARILYVLRDPISWLKSRYAYGVEREGLHLRFEQAIDFGRSPLMYYKRPPIYLPDLFYGEQIDYLNTLLSPADYQILQFENLKAAPQAFLSELAGFLGVTFSEDILTQSAREKVNAVTRDLNLNEQRWANICATIKQSFDVSIAQSFACQDEVFLSEEMEQKLRDYFRGKCYCYQL
ncbi:MAG: hypothetical protein C9356_11635 [Oleiphilus sp.]|nr:MAG: hypothetical protein C9356_11635 [Oleiphilus sp.]